MIRPPNALSVRTVNGCFLLALMSIGLANTQAQATQTWCAVTEKSSDGFVAVRLGPGVSYPAVGKGSTLRLPHKIRRDVGRSETLYYATSQERGFLLRAYRAYTHLP